MPAQKAYDLAPEEIDPYLIEGRIYMEEGEYEKGVKRWAKALEYAPYADTWHEIGMCSMEIGQLSYAKLAFEHVKEMEYQLKADLSVYAAQRQGELHEVQPAVRTSVQAGRVGQIATDTTRR